MGLLSYSIPRILRAYPPVLRLVILCGDTKCLKDVYDDVFYDVDRATVYIIKGTFQLSRRIKCLAGRCCIGLGPVMIILKYLLSE